MAEKKGTINTHEHTPRCDAGGVGHCSSTCSSFAAGMVGTFGPSIGRVVSVNSFGPGIGRVVQYQFAAGMVRSDPVSVELYL